jgi:hypothetical protein
MIVMVAGLVVIGGTAVGGIALAANRADDSPSSVQPHSTPTRSADDHGNNSGNDKESTSDRHGGDPTVAPTTSATCVEDRDDDADEVPGDRHGDPNVPDDDAVSGDRHGGDDGGGRHDGLDDNDQRGHDGPGPSCRD